MKVAVYLIALGVIAYLFALDPALAVVCTVVAFVLVPASTTRGRRRRRRAMRPAPAFHTEGSHSVRAGTRRRGLIHALIARRHRRRDR